MDFTIKGYKVNEVIVNLEKLNDYCIKNNLKNDGKTRLSFVQLD